MKSFFDNELISHIVLEFKHGKISVNNLNEVRHVVPNIDYIVNKFYNIVKKQILDTEENKRNTEAIYTNKEIKIENCFFNNFTLKLNLIYGKNMKNYGGKINPISSFKKDLNGKISFEPKIEITIESNDFYDFIKKFGFCLSHELTHAYDYYQYFVKHGFPESINDILKYGKSRHVDAMMGQFNTQRAIGGVFYGLSRKELNANLGQLRQELINNNPEKIIDSKSAFAAVKRTESYQVNFLNLEKNINIIMSINDENKQKEIIKLTNSIGRKKFTTYNQVKKFYYGLWFKYSSSYLTKASKIVHDVFDEYGPYWEK